MAQFADKPGIATPIVRALGPEFHDLHEAVRRHYGESSIDATGTMDAIHVGGLIKPLAVVSYWLFHAPVPYTGTNVEVKLRNSVDDSGPMYWFRTFLKSPTFRKTVTFSSRMVWAGDHRVIEFIGGGVGVEADLSIDTEGSLVYEVRTYVVRIPLVGWLVRFPPWLSPFGGGRTIEAGQAEDGFRVEFEMSHPVLGRTLAYSGSFRFESGQASTPRSSRQRRHV